MIYKLLYDKLLNISIEIKNVVTLSHRLIFIQHLHPLPLLSHLHRISDDVPSLHIGERQPLYDRHMMPLYHKRSQERYTVEIIGDQTLVSQLAEFVLEVVHFGFHDGIYRCVFLDFYAVDFHI